jgi:nucleotide-binding universal stress UspA family protein
MTVSSTSAGSPAAGHVTVGYDGSPAAERALDWAAVEAGLRQATLQVVVVAPAPDVDSRSFDTTVRPSPSVLDAAQAQLDAAVERLADEHPLVSTSVGVEVGPPVEVLRRKAETASLLVVGSRRVGAIKSLLLGSTSTGLLQVARCPVAVVRNRALPGRGHVVVGLDASTAAEAALRFAFEEADLRRSRLVVVHSIAREPVTTWLGEPPAEREAARKESGERLLRDATRELRDKYANVEVVPVLTHEPAVPALLHRGRRAAVIVVGSRGLTGASTVVLGSVSHALAQAAPCPVVVHRDGA